MRLRRRGRIWYATVYQDGRRIERSTHCTDKAAASIVARQLERDAADPTGAAAHQATLNQALELLLESREELAAAGRRSHATVGFYTCKAGHLVRILGAEFALRLLSAAHVDGFISKRRAEGAAESTIAKELVTLRAALKLAKRRRIWTGDVAEVMPVGFAPEYRPRERFLTVVELQRLLAELLPDRAARVAFIVATSACWGETVRARREDVAEDFSRVHIRGTKTATRERTVPIVTEQGRTLLRYALEHAEGEDGLLFRPWGKSQRDLALASERACRRCLACAHQHTMAEHAELEVGASGERVCTCGAELRTLERCTANDLRRTFGHWMRATGMPLEYVSPAMGHADTKMVEKVYGRLTPDELRDRMLAAVDPDCRTFAAVPQRSGGFSGLDRRTERGS